MLVLSHMASEVITIVNCDGIVYPINSDSTEENKRMKGPYDLLREISGLDSFFFGAQTEFFTGDVEVMLAASNSKNDTLVIMDIPKEELFKMNYDNFDNMLERYFWYYSEEDYKDTILERCKEKLTDLSREPNIQVLIPFLKKEWIVTTVDSSFLTTTGKFTFPPKPEADEVQKIMNGVLGYDPALKDFELIKELANC